MVGTEIILVRHGESEWNVIGRYQGQLDIPLSTRGMEQAAQTARCLSSQQFAAVISSPLQRARFTAEAIAACHHLPVHIEPALTEINHGTWQGMETATVVEQYPEMLAIWKKHPARVTMPGGESIADLQERVHPAMLSLVTAWEGRRIVVVTHDAILRVILLDALGMEMDRFWQIAIDNASISRLCYQPDSLARPQLLSLNETTQLGSLKSDPARHAL